MIEGIPVLEDNYVWLLIEGRRCALVDPGEGEPVLEAVERAGAEVQTVLLTHHHGDHVGGLPDVLRAFPRAQVLASKVDQERVPGVTRGLTDGERVDVLGTRFTVMATPGHTRGALTYYAAAISAAFTGDTLFGAGCGRLFEGTPAEMFASLRRIAELPPHTSIYCGHEYTERNLRFAAHRDPADRAITERLRETTLRRAEGFSTVPSTLEVELQTNLFLRAESVEAFAAVREARNHW